MASTTGSNLLKRLKNIDDLDKQFRRPTGITSIIRILIFQSPIHHQLGKTQEQAKLVVTFV